jgi:hypothetical protein
VEGEKGEKRSSESDRRRRVRRKREMVEWRRENYWMYEAKTVNK